MNKPSYQIALSVDIMKMLIIQTFCVLLGMWIYTIDKMNQAQLFYYYSLLVLSYYPYGRNLISLDSLHRY